MSCLLLIPSTTFCPPGKNPRALWTTADFHEFHCACSKAAIPVHEKERKTLHADASKHHAPKRIMQLESKLKICHCKNWKEKDMWVKEGGKEVSLFLNPYIWNILSHEWNIYICVCVYASFKKKKKWSPTTHPQKGKQKSPLLWLETMAFFSYNNGIIICKKHSQGSFRSTGAPLWLDCVGPSWARTLYLSQWHHAHPPSAHQLRWNVLWHLRPCLSWGQRKDGCGDRG